jgi:acetyl esterase/lipase
MKITLALLLYAFTSFAQDARLPQQRLPEGFAAKRNVEYVPGGGARRLLDVYYPEKTDKPVPLVVWIHGGAWSAGTKDRTPALPLLEKGFAVASVTYRFSQDAVFPAQIEDCKSAIRWLRKNAATMNINPDKIGVWGGSAGGHLVAMLGVSGDVKEWEKGENLDQSSRVQAVCDWFGPSNLLTFGPQGGNDRPKGQRPFPATDAPDSPEGRLIGGAVPENKEKAKAASPTTYVTKDDAPFLIIHGDKDPLVPAAQSTELHELLEKTGVPTKLIILQGAGHGGPQFNSRETMAQVEEFFARTLKN